MDEQSKRYKFLDVFQELPGGSLSPKIQVEINGVFFGPGVVFQRGIAFWGVDFHLYKYLDVAVVEQPDNHLKIIGFYK